MKKPHQWLAWVSTISLLIAAALAAFNVYPLYTFAFILSNSLWTLVGIIWKENSLIVMNSGLTLIYIIGLLF